MSEKGTELLLSGKAEFKIQVPHKVFETGVAVKKKPVIVYLHGFGQTIKSFKKECGPLMAVEAYHLFIQAPYPIYNRSREKRVDDWGRAWYLYDGDQSQFRSSLDHASRFIREVIANMAKVVNGNRLCLIGFSMGGYLAGYHAMNVPEQVNELIIYGARYKSELLIGDYQKISHQKILALHGNDDNIVESGPQQKEMRVLRQNGVDATFKRVDESHTFSKTVADQIVKWLSGIGYNR